MKISIMTRVYWKCYEWPGRTFNFTLSQILNRIAKSGLSYVDFCEYPLEFWPLDITEKEVNILYDKLARINLKTSGVTVPTFSPGLEILPEESDRQLIIDRLKRAIEIVYKLKGKTMMYGISPIPIYASMGETYRWTLNLFYECLDIAEKLDVDIAVEFVNHYFKTSEKIIEFLKDVGSENVGLCLEVGNTMARPPGETLIQHLKKCGEKVKLVHVNDPLNEELLKSINVDLSETIKNLRDLGYEGFIVIESLNDSISCSELDSEVAKAAKYLSGLVGKFITR
ncbi:MAG: sugar phosphate isomerase/epimerase [Thermoproteota archaeon]